MSEPRISPERLLELESMVPKLMTGGIWTLSSIEVCDLILDLADDRRELSSLRGLAVPVGIPHLRNPEAVEDNRENEMDGVEYEFHPEAHEGAVATQPGARVMPDVSSGKDANLGPPLPGSLTLGATQ